MIRIDRESKDPFDLERFIAPQEDSFETALGEISAGKKNSHWMWYVFPQLLGLGSSETSRHFAIRGLGEAKAYLAHPLLGKRLATATSLAIQHSNGGATKLFGSPDDLKFHSSLTLFFLASGHSSPFSDALEKFFGGKLDEHTQAILESRSRDANQED